MKKIIVSVSATGAPQVNAEGYAGGECATKSAGIIGALSGNNSNDVEVTEKPEMFASGGEEMETEGFGI